jgi:2-amino-4-hydroxy-6-hydroxymethyldihydropteridine diphosphokinase
MGVLVEGVADHYPRAGPATAALSVESGPGYILGIGTNVDPERNSLRILDRLTATFGPVLVSQFHYSDPVGMRSARRFINFCAFVRTDLGARDCKTACVEIEVGLGRDRTAPGCKTADRPADIDILTHLSGEADELDPMEVAGADYLLQPTRELLDRLRHEPEAVEIERLLRVLSPLPQTPAAVDRDYRAGLKVVR